MKPSITAAVALAGASALVLAATPTSAAGLLAFYGPGSYTFIVPTAGAYQITAAGGIGGYGGTGGRGGKGGVGGTGGAASGYPVYPGHPASAGAAGRNGQAGQPGFAGAPGLAAGGDFTLAANQTLTIYVGAHGSSGVFQPTQGQASDGLNGVSGQFAGGGGGGGAGGLGGLAGDRGQGGDFSSVLGLILSSGGTGGDGGNGGFGGQGGGGGAGSAADVAGFCYLGIGCGSTYAGQDGLGGQGGLSGNSFLDGQQGSQGTFFRTAHLFDYKYASVGGLGGAGGPGGFGAIGLGGVPGLGAGSEYNLGSNPTSGANFGDGYISIYQLGPLVGVPEPASWAMMVIGAGLIGGASRKARSRTVAAI